MPEQLPVLKPENPKPVMNLTEKPKPTERLSGPTPLMTAPEPPKRPTPVEKSPEQPKLVQKASPIEKILQLSERIVNHSNQHRPKSSEKPTPLPQNEFPNPPEKVLTPSQGRSTTLTRKQRKALKYPAPDYWRTVLKLH